MMRRLRALGHLPAPNRAGWHQAIRMTCAALLANVATALVGLPHGYWAVITCLIIVQGSLGATIGAGIARLAGTAAGVVLGGVGVLLLRVDAQLPEWLVLLIVIAPLALLVASRPIFKFAPFTGALVLLLAGSGDLTFALNRIGEIALGCIIGVLVSLFVLPERATAVLVNHAAATLEQLGEFAMVLLVGTDPQTRANFEFKMRHAYVQIQNDLKEVDNERSVLLLRSDPFPERLLRHMQRLRTDVNMLGRAVARQGENDDLGELGNSIKLQFHSAAAVLRSRRVPEMTGWLRQTPRIADAETPLGFAVATLQHEFTELEACLREWITPENSAAEG
jgi:uncharacterized membrane protein YccC